ncbi:hypothetical protein NA57DRAFT_61651 [Rhizodiscina lignyota]|uniref:Transmembrane protein n=1 Tax=Rhizodiscina lignyota TaxID=1504668 RepID=A0A9P4I4Q7_9PEZI|nr:hypothetical protein NA57DRAFT_61651 [Rhizodiscina lignyota]
MAPQQHEQLSHEDAKGQLDAILLRDPDDRLAPLLCTEGDTHIYTKSFPSENFLAGTYGTAGPSTTTPSSQPSNPVFSAETGNTFTEPSSCAASNNGNNTKKQSVTWSVVANRGSSTDDSSGAGSGSDTDQTGTVEVGNMGSHFEPGAARRAVKDKKKYRPYICHCRRKLDTGRTDTRTVLENQPTHHTEPSASDRDVEADYQLVNKPTSASSPWPSKLKMVSMIAFCSLATILGALFFALANTNHETSEVISAILIGLLTVSVIVLSLAVVRTHGESPKAARCIFSLGVGLIAFTASLLALSIGRSFADCCLVLIATVVVLMPLQGELTTLLS